MARDVFIGSLDDYLNPPDEQPDTDDGYTAEEEAAYWAALDELDRIGAGGEGS